MLSCLTQFKSEYEIHKGSVQGKVKKGTHTSPETEDEGKLRQQINLTTLTKFTAKASK